MMKHSLGYLLVFEIWKMDVCLLMKLTVVLVLLILKFLVFLNVS